MSFVFVYYEKFKTNVTGALVVVATGANSVVVGLVEGKTDDDPVGKPPEAGAASAVAGVAPKETGAVRAGVVILLPPNGVADEPAPNANEEVVVVGTEVTVAVGVPPNANVEG